MSRGPAQAELMQAADRRVPDVIAPGLAVLFCGINPGLYSAWAAHHFARPGNRFWPTLHAAGFTPRRFAPAEERGLLELGYGITNIVPRATTAAAQLAPDELARGARLLEAKVQRFAPRAVAVLGIGAYRSAFGRPRAGLGRQPDDIGGALAWVLPNPSGLNASYRPADLVRLFAELRDGVEGLAGRSGSGR